MPDDLTSKERVCLLQRTVKLMRMQLVKSYNIIKKLHKERKELRDRLQKYENISVALYGVCTLVVEFFNMGGG